MISLEKVAILIPAYEAADTLGQVVSDWFEFGACANQIWIVDDGSPDGTGEVAQSMGVNVLTHDTNKGKGAAHKTGFSYLLKNTDYQWIMTMDADTQHDVGEANRFLSLDETGFDIAIGTRRHNMVGMPFDRWFVNRLTSTVLSIFGGQQLVTDSQNGFRLISSQVLRKIPLKTDHFDTESELVARALHAGYRITEVPITTLYTSPRSHINPFIDTLRFIRLCFRYLLWMG